MDCGLSDGRPQRLSINFNVDVRCISLRGRETERRSSHLAGPPVLARRTSCGTTYGMGCACGMHAFVSVLGRRAGTEGADNRTGSDVRTCGCAVGCRAFQLRNIAKPSHASRAVHVRDGKIEVRVRCFAGVSETHFV